jgi:hypothetical protein
MKQALFLAQRLLQAEKQRDQYKEQLIDYENRFHSLQAEVRCSYAMPHLICMLTDGEIHL